MTSRSERSVATPQQTGRRSWPWTGVLLLEADTLIRSKVARRIVMLFVLCAMLPVACLAVVAFRQVSAELREASRRRLHQTAKSASMDVLDRLRRADAELGLLEIVMRASGSVHPVLTTSDERARLSQRFSSLTITTADGTSRHVLGTPLQAPTLTPPELAHLHSARAVLSVRSSVSGQPLVLLRRRVSVGGADAVLTGAVDDGFLFEGDMVPTPMVVHVFGASGQRLFDSDPDVDTPAVGLDDRRAVVGELTWSRGDATYLAYRFSLPLAFDFLEPRWAVVVSEPVESVFAPIARAQSTFVLITLLSLWVVLLLSLRQIRRSLIPLARLREATQRIGQGDFDGCVAVRSGDEFEDLALSLNGMSSELRRHFNTQLAVAELERAVLSSLDETTIVQHTLDRLPALFHCDRAVLMRHSDGNASEAHGIDAGLVNLVTLPSPADAASIATVTQLSIYQRAQPDLPACLTTLDVEPWEMCVAVPVVLASGVDGVVLLAYHRQRSFSVEDSVQAEQIVRQMAVAISNARLMRSLDRLNVGTINALGRTVDAKSPWTAGHSQRVTALAVEIGAAMGESASTLDTLQRGGLLHDIGKIAVPNAILNKPGRLTDEELAVMKGHPRAGARILEPIEEYHRLIPIVLQHHEWFDGRGYPDGVAGEAISLGARILAVADVFDALTSDRPYRAAMPVAKATEMICAGSGTQFDPEVVRVFVQLMASRERTSDVAA